MVSRIIRVEVSVISRAEGEIGNTCRDLGLGHSGYHLPRTQALWFVYVIKRTWDGTTDDR